MSSGGMDLPRSSCELVRSSLLYQEHRAEHEEILRHKWFESEKAGYDIGFDLARVDWRLRHYPHWWRHRQRGSLA